MANKTKRPLSKTQKAISNAATQIQRKGGLVTVTQKRYKIDRPTAIKKAHSALVMAGTIPKPKSKKKK